MTNYKRAFFCLTNVFPCVCVCVCVHDHFALWMFFSLLEVCHLISVHVCSALFLILRMNLVYFLCGVSRSIFVDLDPVLTTVQSLMPFGQRKRFFFFKFSKRN